MSNHHRRRPRMSPYMKGPPLRSTLTTDQTQAVATIESGLHGCTCTPIIHCYDAGNNAVGMSLLHDDTCQRLEQLKAEAN